MVRSSARQPHIVRERLAASADIQPCNKYGETVLYEAAYHSSLAVVQVQVQAGADLHARSNPNCRVIHRAAEAGRIDTVQWILNVTTLPPVCLGARAGPRCTRLRLLANVPWPGSCSSTGLTRRSDPSPVATRLYITVRVRSELKQGERKDDATLVRDLIEYGADVNLPADARCLLSSGKTGESLHQQLFEAQLDEPPPELVYPIHSAVLPGMPSKVEALLEEGADINARTSVYGSTPLHLAAPRGQLEMARFLLCNGAEPEAPDAAGWKMTHQNIVT